VLAAACASENAPLFARQPEAPVAAAGAPCYPASTASTPSSAAGRATEWAADDEAVAGDAHLSLSLAAALVRVARISGAPQPLPLSASFLGDTREISARVDRLLNPAPAVTPPSRSSALIAGGAALAAGCAVAMLRPATLESAHRLLEHLIN
jgi:hypothetical protein